MARCMGRYQVAGAFMRETSKGGVTAEPAAGVSTFPPATGRVPVRQLSPADAVIRAVMKGEPEQPLLRLSCQAPPFSCRAWRLSNRKW